MPVDPATNAETSEGMTAATVIARFDILQQQIGRMQKLYEEVQGHVAVLSKGKGGGNEKREQTNHAVLSSKALF